MKPDQKLPAEERIKQKKLFDLIFDKGQSFRAHPLKLVYKETDFNEDHPVKIAVIVPKRWMKHAHDRNRQKRLLREAYRLNKHIISDPSRQQKKGLALIFLAQCKSPLSYSETEGKIILLLQRLRAVYAKADR